MITLIIGRREQGKTTLALHLAREQAPTCVEFDPRRSFHSGTILSGADGLFESLDEEKEIVVQPPFEVKQTFSEMCGVVVDWIEENPEEPLALLVDEARFVDTPSEICPSFDYILRFTPRDTVHTFLTAHRPVDIAVDIRAIADFWCMFHTTQEHDLKIISERCGGEVAEQVRALHDREFIVWNDGRATSHKVSDARVWFEPLTSIESETANVA